VNEETKTKSIPELKNDYRAAKLAAAELKDLLLEKDRELKQQIEKLQNEFLEKNAELIEAELQARDAFLNADTALREAMCNYYYYNQVKRIDGELSVRVNKRLVYDDELALEWAKEHQLCLSLDKKSFEKIAPDLKLDFVTTEEKPVAVISIKDDSR
jgi:hypothetical protein